MRTSRTRAAKSKTFLCAAVARAGRTAVCKTTPKPKNGGPPTGNPWERIPLREPALCFLLQEYRAEGTNPPVGACGFCPATDRLIRRDTMPAAALYSPQKNKRFAARRARKTGVTAGKDGRKRDPRAAYLRKNRRGDATPRPPGGTLRVEAARAHCGEESPALCAFGRVTPNRAAVFFAFYR